MELFRRLGVARETAGRRTAGGLPERHRLSHDDGRAGADAHPDPLPPRPLHRHGRPGYLVADPGAAAPDQPDLSRTDPLRRTPRRRPASRSSIASRSTDLTQDDDGVTARARDLDTGRGARLSPRATCRLRRRAVRGAPRDRRAAARAIRSCSASSRPTSARRSCCRSWTARRRGAISRSTRAAAAPSTPSMGARPG